MNEQHKIEQLKKALTILLEACDWDDVAEVGGEPLERAIENANDVLKYVDIDSESINPGDYTQCSTCPSMITWEDFARNNGQCLECSPADSEDENLEIESDDLWDDDYLTDWVGDMGDN